MKRKFHQQTETEPPNPLEWIPAYVAKRQLGFTLTERKRPHRKDAHEEPGEKVAIKTRTYDGIEYWFRQDFQRLLDRIAELTRQAVNQFNDLIKAELDDLNNSGHGALGYGGDF